MWGGDVPFPVYWGSVVKSAAGSGAEPPPRQQETILRSFMCNLCDFTHRLVHLTAANIWEIPASLYWLVVLMFPVNSWDIEHPRIEFVCVSGLPRHHSEAHRTVCKLYILPLPVNGAVL